MKIFVVKGFFPVNENGDEEQVTIAYALTHKKAKELAEAYAKGRWVIEEQPIGCRLDPRKRRESWYIDMMMGDKFIPAGTLVGPYDGFIMMTRMKE